ncbi:MAG: hypothetical protein GQ544_01555 [Candidatus Aminicenantes bacterium]|nr:hypothetical protein [Candidatus Aminicenantes bacterium]
MLFFMVGSQIPAQPTESDQSPPLRLIEGWQFRWGDSALDEDGVPVWTYEDLESQEWKPAPAAVYLPDYEGSHTLWLRVPLPEVTWDEPTVFLPRVFLTLEVYLERELIYSYGELKANRSNRFAAFVPHRLFLPSDYQGKYLFFRIYSDLPRANGIEGRIVMGSREQLLLYLFKKDIGGFLVGIFCIFVGLFALIICLDRNVRANLAPYSFGIFALAIGLTFIGLIPPLTMIIQAPIFWYFALFLSYYIFPVGLLSFVDQVVGSGPIKILRRLWQLHVLILLFAFILELLGLSMALWFPYIRFLWIFDCLIMIAVCGYSAIKGKYAAKVFTIGILFFAVFAIHDMFNTARTTPLMPFGTLIFIVLLGYILFYRSTENSRRLRIYSKELEEKSIKLEEAKKQLEEYSRTLEEKVEERTREVKEKQVQLVQSSKMAALGSLVAGVAHEINTPVGAISSMHNTLIRAVKKLKGDVDACIQDTKLEKEKISSTLKIVDDANQVIQSGTERVIDIVKRLRSFARLDEAELKDADIHEGLEDTLTIIHHQIKDKVTLFKNYGEIPKISCFPGRLNQVFLNLLINAKQAMKDGGEIHISTFLKDDKVYIKIQDNGEGIPQESLGKVFDPGFTTKGVGVGTGLGLSICYQIIQDHLGEIRVESEVDKGTTFTIILPTDLDERLVA